MLELPKLTALTLASPIGGGGGTGGGGSTVFVILLALGVSLGAAGCAADRTSESAPSSLPVLAREIPCIANVAARTVSCGGPSATAGPEIMGGSGQFVALRSADVHYDSGTEEFSFNASVQNLTAQTLGTSDGVVTTGISVFFEVDPYATSGVGSISVLGASTGTFTATGQTYYFYNTTLAPLDSTASESWIFSVPSTVTTFSFTVMVAAEVPVPASVLGWERMLLSGTEFAGLVDIAANSPTDAMAVGVNGLVLHKGAGGWEILRSQVTESWTGVEAIGSGRYLGSTASGRILLYQNHVWRPYRTAPFAITTLAAASLGRVVVGGVGAAKWWLDNGDSVSLSPGTGGYAFTASAVNGPAPQFMMGTMGGHTLRGFFNTPTPTVQLSVGVTAIAGGGTNNPLVARWNGSGASLTDFNLAFDYVGFASDTIIPAVTYGAGGVGAQFWRASQSMTGGATRLESFNGSWTSRAIVTDTVRTMIDDQNGGIYLLTDRGIERWNGTAVVDEFVATPVVLGQVAGTDGSAILSTGTGPVYQFDGTAWTVRDPGIGFVQAVFALGPDDQYAGSNSGGIAHWDGASWTIERAAGSGEIRSISGVPGLMMAAGGTAIYANSGSGWSQVTDPDVGADSMQSVYVASTTAAWVGAKFLKVYRFDGADWTRDFSFGLQGGTVRITGTSASDVWISHADSVRHWNGSSWSGDLAPGGAGFVFGMGSASPNQLAVRFGNIGAVFLSDAGANFPLNTGGTTDPYGFGGIGPTGLWAVDDQGEVWRSRR